MIDVCYTFDALHTEHEFFDLISGEVHRWRSILCAGMRPDPLIHLLPLSAPNPVDVHIRTDGPPRLTEIFGGDLKRLRHLSLHGLALRWNDCPLSHLRTLRLCRLEELSPSVDELFGILRGCPDLLELELEQVGRTSEILTTASTRQTLIHLPALHSLVISELRLHYLHDILAAVQLPENVHLDVTQTLADDDDFFVASPPILDLCRTALSKAGHGYIEVGSSSLDLDCASRSLDPPPALLTVSLSGPLVPCSSLLDSLAVILAPPFPGVDIHFTFDWPI